jgi:hypothetical protein
MTSPSSRIMACSSSISRRWQWCTALSSAWRAGGAAEGVWGDVSELAACLALAVTASGDALGAGSCVAGDGAGVRVGR